jgi:FkbM family methyltransferase
VKNVEMAGLKNVRTINAAIADHVGTMSFTTCQKSILASASYPLPTKYAPQEIQVPCTTLETIMSDNGINVINTLKMDCQGAEHQVLATVSHAVMERISQIVMEIHGESTQLLDRLTQLGYDVILPQPIYAYRKNAIECLNSRDELISSGTSAHPLLP